jgi:Relaxase/Mobilisation nuclease domain
MATAFDAVSSWFEPGFKVRKQKAARAGSKADKVRSSGGAPVSRRGGHVQSAAAKSANIKAVIKKAPEVMVKITGSSMGTRGFKAHIDYISRNGKIELENESEDKLQGVATLRGLRDEHKASQVPFEGKKREFLHVMFSMPEGTPERELRKAVAEFCKSEFSNRRYVMAFHSDTKSPHVHVCVATRDMDRADELRLSPRKNDIFKWRQGFAEKLRDQGVDAAASGRAVRFNSRKSEKGAIRQIRQDNPASPVFKRERADRRVAARLDGALARPATAFVGAPRPPRTPAVYAKLGKEIAAAVDAKTPLVNPLAGKITAARLAAFEQWQIVAASLEKSGDFELALQVREVAKSGAIEKPTRNQELYDAAMLQRGRDNVGQRNQGLER